MEHPPKQRALPVQKRKCDVVAMMSHKLTNRLNSPKVRGLPGRALLVSTSRTVVMYVIGRKYRSHPR
jgi:hypothetical protein